MSTTEESKSKTAPPLSKDRENDEKPIKPSNSENSPEFQESQRKASNILQTLLKSENFRKGAIFHVEYGKHKAELLDSSENFYHSLKNDELVELCGAFYRSNAADKEQGKDYWYLEGEKYVHHETKEKKGHKGGTVKGVKEGTSQAWFLCARKKEILLVVFGEGNQNEAQNELEKAVFGTGPSTDHADDSGDDKSSANTKGGEKEGKTDEKTTQETKKD